MARPDWTGRTGKQNKKAEQDSQNRTARIGQAEQDGQNWTGRTGLAEQGCQDTTARTPLPGQGCQHMIGSDSQDRTERIG
jgi:hypothetical protein